MANKESLIIELDAKTQKLDAKLKETNRRIDHLDGSVSKADNSLKKFSTSAKVMATAVTAIAASVAIAVTQAGKFSRELTIAFSFKHLTLPPNKTEESRVGAGL